jgi:hypothetical protein
MHSRIIRKGWREVKVKELLSGPEKWTKGAFKRDEDGKPCSHTGKPPVSYCLIAAVEECYYEEEPEYSDVIGRIAAAIGRWDIEEWNDSPVRRFEDVKELVERLDI